MELKSVKGTRDFFPTQMRLRNWLFEQWRETAQQFGFEEYDACVLEHEELYLRKAGDEISQQLYNFTDKGGRRLSLRPEMTPSLARMILQNQKAFSFPIKWFSIAQCFRYERMTKGRKREHFQWNVDIVGQSKEVAEAEMIAMILTFCSRVNLTSKHIQVFLNDRRIVNRILSTLQIPEASHLEIMVLMDKRDKLSQDLFEKMLYEAGLSDWQIRELQSYLSVSSLEKLSKLLADETSFSSLRKVFEFLNASGWGEYLQFDVSVIRGLSYYTGTVFEVHDISKTQRAICGGGRYDSLFSAYGGESIPAVGFGFGDVVIMDLLTDHQLLPSLKSYCEYMIVPFSAEQTAVALQISSMLRKAGASVTCNFGFRKIKKSLQQANEAGVEKVILLFPEELSKRQVVVRDMVTREQNPIAIDELIPSF